MQRYKISTKKKSGKRSLLLQKIPVSFYEGIVVLPGLYLLQLVDMSVATSTKI